MEDKTKQIEAWAGAEWARNWRISLGISFGRNWAWQANPSGELDFGPYLVLFDSERVVARVADSWFIVAHLSFRELELDPEVRALERAHDGGSNGSSVSGCWWSVERLAANPLAATGTKSKENPRACLRLNLCTWFGLRAGKVSSPLQSSVWSLAATWTNQARLL